MALSPERLARQKKAAEVRANRPVRERPVFEGVSQTPEKIAEGVFDLHSVERLGGAKVGEDLRRGDTKQRRKEFIQASTAGEFDATPEGVTAFNAQFDKNKALSADSIPLGSLGPQNGSTTPKPVAEDRSERARPSPVVDRVGPDVGIQTLSGDTRIPPVVDREPTPTAEVPTVDHTFPNGLTGAQMQEMLANNPNLTMSDLLNLGGNVLTGGSDLGFQPNLPGGVPRGNSPTPTDQNVPRGGAGRGPGNNIPLPGGGGVGDPATTATGTGTGETTELPADTIIQTLASQAASPVLPEGGTFTPVQQILQDSELEQAITLRPIAGMRAAVITGPDGIDVPLMQALRMGTNVPQIQSILGSVPPEAIIQAAQAENIPDIEIPNILQRAGIDPAVISGLPQMRAARAALSQAATMTAATGTESPEFRAAVDAERDRLINFPVDPRSTVQEQYAGLMADVNSGTTPPWAAAAVRAAEGKLAARGMGSSSIAAEGITAALMQAALPIATQDAQVFQTMNLEKFSSTAALGMMRASHLATMDQTSLNNQQQANVQNAQSALQIDLTNLNNEQQAAVVNAQQALAIATSNAGFAQQASIEDARQALQIDLSNLDANTRASIQNAQNMLTIETTNLGARTQALSENARAFLGMEMSNLDRSQQSAIVNSQTRMQGLLSDYASANLARQINTQNTVETARFMTEMGQRAQEYNASQRQDINMFNRSIADSRDKFNVENAAMIERSNVDYLRRINTANTANENQANLINAQNLLGVSNAALANLVTVARDREAFNFQASENSEERATRRAIAQLTSSTNLTLQNNQQKANNAAFLGGLASDVLGDILSPIGDALKDKIADIFT